MISSFRDADTKQLYETGENMRTKNLIHPGEILPESCPSPLFML